EPAARSRRRVVASAPGVGAMAVAVARVFRLPLVGLRILIFLTAVVAMVFMHLAMISVHAKLATMQLVQFMQILQAVLLAMTSVLVMMVVVVVFMMMMMVVVMAMGVAVRMLYDAYRAPLLVHRPRA
ncbi:hypothetical protein Vretimale_3074, partial [Volvox reticuliferus]